MCVGVGGWVGWWVWAYDFVIRKTKLLVTIIV